MPIPYTPQGTSKRFRVPRTLAADFDAFLDRDIPNTNMDFEILKNWYDRYEDEYEPQYVRGEIYADTTKSRYENTDNNMNIRCSVSSGIRKGDMLIEPDGTIYILDWEVHLQSNNAPSRALRCNMILTVFRHKNAEVDDEGYLIDDEGYVIAGDKYAHGVKHHKDVVTHYTCETMDMPFCALLFQSLIALYHAFPACPSHGKLHRHYRYSHNDKKQQVEQNKDGSSVCACHIRKLPDITDPDGTSGAYKDKAYPGCEILSFVFSSHLFPPHY